LNARVAPPTEPLSRTAGEGGAGRSPTTGESVSSAEASLTLGSILDAAAEELSEAAFEEPRRQARRLLAAALGWSPTEVFAHPERRLDEPQQARIAQTLKRAMAREPLSRIAGRREFWGLEFLLSADTLDPRPETETVVDAVLRRLPSRGRPYRFLDLGTGSGCLLLALLAEFPQATGFGIDIAPGAVETAGNNARRLGLADRAGFAVGNWGEAVTGCFDAVVANPPYIPAPDIAGLPPEVRDYDPRRALDGGADGLAAYRRIAADLPRLLAQAGFFACEIGSTQADAVAAILIGAGLRHRETARDLAGLPRCIVATPGSP
jgi:release factor glutamine methyltransferase